MELLYPRDSNRQKKENKISLKVIWQRGIFLSTLDYAKKEKKNWRTDFFVFVSACCHDNRNKYILYVPSWTLFLFPCSMVPYPHNLQTVQGAYSNLKIDIIFFFLVIPQTKYYLGKAILYNFSAGSQLFVNLLEFHNNIYGKRSCCDFGGLNGKLAKQGTTKERQEYNVISTHDL